MRHAILCLVLVFAGCAGVAVQTDYDPAKAPQLASYRTYAWLEQPVSNEARVNNPIMRGVVQAAVERELAAKGLRRAAPGVDPDVRIAWAAVVRDRVAIDTLPGWYGYSMGGWYGPGWGFGAPMTRVREYVEGTLVVDLIDARANELVWRGVAESEVADTAEQRAERLRESVHELFEGFPPARPAS